MQEQKLDIKESFFSVLGISLNQISYDKLHQRDVTLLWHVLCINANAQVDRKQLSTDYNTLPWI